MDWLIFFALFFGVICAFLYQIHKRATIQHLNEKGYIDRDGDAGGHSLKCQACDAVHLTRLAQGTYRCDECDYVGGPGYSAYIESKRLEQVLEQPMHVRRKKAISTLNDVILETLSMQGFIGGALSESETDVSMARSATNTDIFAQEDKKRHLRKVKDMIAHHNHQIEWVERLLNETLNDLKLAPNMEFLLSETQRHIHSHAMSRKARAARKLERGIHEQLLAFDDELKMLELNMRKKIAILKMPAARASTARQR